MQDKEDSITEVRAKVDNMINSAIEDSSYAYALGRLQGLVGILVREVP